MPSAMTVGISIGTMMRSMSSVSRKAPSSRKRTVTTSMKAAGESSRLMIQAPIASGICSAATTQFITSAPAMVSATMPVDRAELTSTR